ncbi:helix-turn-helix transcriptional regulator [Enterobacterales bacterium CwR94]|nr:helix-turn-helix transcriptional regulator [Enterobacterales bacterium CwR94]
MSRDKDDHEYLHAFISMMDNLSDPWGIKDLHSRHVYMNKAAFAYTNTPLTFKIEGVRDEDFPAVWAECADELIEHDKRTEETKERVTVIETHYWFGRKELSPYISEKLPIFNNKGECIGVIWNAKPFDNRTPLNFINQKTPTVLTTEVATKTFTKAELDIVFLMLQRMSAKEIANIYDVSVRTIENRIHSIYQKADVHSLQQFEEYCVKHNLENYIPGRLINKGITFI